MLRIALKGVLARKTRLLLTSLAVMLGTAFLTATAVFSDTIKQTFDNLFADVYKNVDAYTRSTNVVEGDFGLETRGKVDASVIQAIAAVPGVKDAQGSVTQFAIIIDKNGKALIQSNGPPTLGGTIGHGDLKLWNVVQGREPASGDEVVIDKTSFKRAGIALGQPVRVTSILGTRTFTLVGVAKFGKADSPGGATFALFDDATAAEFLNGNASSFDSILVRGDGTVTQQELTDRINAKLANPAVETITGQQITKETQSDVRKGLSFFTTFLKTFAFIALFVATFVIYNLFSITVAQRRRENALLRAVGASRRQVTTSLLVESFAIGVIGSIIGIFAGLGLSVLLKAFMNAVNIDIPSSGVTLRGFTIVSSMIIGVVVTLASALLPALRSSKVPPVAAMRAEAIEQPSWSRSRFISGAIVLVIGIVGVLGALFGGKIILLVPGVLGLFVGMFVLGPLLARPVAGLSRRPLTMARGITGQMAAENAARNPKRTARTAAAIFVATTLVVGVTVLASSLKGSVRNIFGRSMIGDLSVDATSNGPNGSIPISLATELSKLPEVDVASGVAIGHTYLKGKTHDTPVSAVDPATIGQVFDLKLVQGRMEDLDNNSIAISKDHADGKDLTLGDKVEFDRLAGQARTLTIVAIYDEDILAGPYTVSKSLYEGSDDNLTDIAVVIKVASGVSVQQALEATNALTKQVAPGASVLTKKEYIDKQVKQIDPLINFIYAMLLLSGIIAAVGVLITMLLSIYERNRELGLLRAVGMSRSQVRSSVRWEAVVVTVFGAVQGLLIGFLLAFAVVRALADQGFGTFSVPWLLLIVFMIVAIVGGIVSAIIPARRATKVNILDAIARA